MAETRTYRGKRKGAKSSGAANSSKPDNGNGGAVVAQTDAQLEAETQQSWVGAGVCHNVAQGTAFDQLAHCLVT